MRKGIVLYLDREIAEEERWAFLSEGNRLSSLLCRDLYGICFLHPGVEEKGLEAYGLWKLFVIEGTEFEEYDFHLFGSALSEALRGLPFELLLFPHSQIGRELACWVAEAFGTFAVTDCVDVRIREGRPIYVRHVYGGQYEQELTLPESSPHVVSLNLHHLDKRRPYFSSSLEKIKISLKPAVERRTKNLETIAPHFSTVDLSFADLIIGVGAGCLDGEVLNLVEELSSCMEAPCGVTRPVVDEGYFPKERMVGQTGRTVSPKLYLALGISGSPHHMAGIRGAQRIVAINRDERAPILGLSDLAFVCDLKEVLPILIEKVREIKTHGKV
jgi:electron transfer flavoprotein alpha subunit